MKGVNQYTYKNPDEKLLKEIVEYLKENTIKDTCKHFNISRTQFYTLRDKKLLNYELLLNENKRFNNKKISDLNILKKPKSFYLKNVRNGLLKIQINLLICYHIKVEVKLMLKSILENG